MNGIQERPRIAQIVDLTEAVGQRMREYLAITLRDAGIVDLSPARSLILLRLVAAGETTISQFVCDGGYYNTNASYNLSQLVAADYVNRWTSPEDKRMRYIAATEKGRRAAGIVEAALRKHPAEMSGSEAAAAATVLRRIARTG